MPVINRIAHYHDEMTAWRRDFHMHPEIGFEEVRTSGIVAEKLEEFGLDQVHKGLGRTGVVGVLHGRNGPGPAIGLRADMDALPMTEESDIPHKSTIPGRMHGCGHDGHTTMLLGAAKYLAETRNFEGTVYFIFQPAEEGLGGAVEMVDQGLFDKFPAKQVYGMHNWPEMPVGTAAVRGGPMMASSDKFEMTITGKGGHAAMPHLCIDPMPIAAQIINAWQTIVSRYTDPLDQVVITVPMISGGDAFNVIPDTVEMGGTVRTFSHDTQDRVEAQMETVAKGIAEAFGASINFNYMRGYPATINSAHEADLMAQAAAKVVGDDKVMREFNPCMGAEDFAYMLKEKPGAYLWLGQARGPDEAFCHNPKYDFNDDILPIGASLWAALVEQELPVAEAA
ncbi:MAG: M20 aminoacylase family protein [Alphaproteobacteria bacterium]